jgi:phage shock protein PspC (stress-responsive transcriptional regulator)
MSIYSGQLLELKGMMGIIEQLKHYFEKHAFGVCTALGDKLGIATSSIRLFFIYTSFLTLGSPVILYLSLAFIMNIRAHLRKRSTIWDF